MTEQDWHDTRSLFDLLREVPGHFRFDRKLLLLELAVHGLRRDLATEQTTSRVTWLEQLILAPDSPPDFEAIDTLLDELAESANQYDHGNATAADTAHWCVLGDLVMENWGANADDLTEVYEEDHPLILARLPYLDLVREIFGNPFRPVAFSPSWRTEHTIGLAAKMYDEREFAAMPILADALEEAGCDNQDILAHCREPGVHVRGCWVVDLVLGKE